MRQQSLGNPHRRTSVEEQIEQCVQFALRGAAPDRTHDERRREKRHAFPYPVRLTPASARGEVVGEPITVIGKHLSKHGFDFYCQYPVPHRRVIASFDCELRDRVAILMDLTWCRFNGNGWYENGGRFLAMIGPPLPDKSSGLVACVECAITSINEIHA